MHKVNQQKLYGDNMTYQEQLELFKLSTKYINVLDIYKRQKTTTWKLFEQPGFEVRQVFTRVQHSKWFQAEQLNTTKKTKNTRLKTTDKKPNSSDSSPEYQLEPTTAVRQAQIPSHTRLLQTKRHASTEIAVRQAQISSRSRLLQTTTTKIPASTEVEVRQANVPSHSRLLQTRHHRTSCTRVPSLAD